MEMIDRLFSDITEALAGEYSVQRELGRGGMGVVFLARDLQLDRLVAIKVLPRQSAAEKDIRRRFLSEARLSAQLFHPNIVPIYRVGEASGLPYFVMAYIDGETLGDRLRRRGPLGASAMAAVLRDVGQALGYAHGSGVVHRDIKPDNILLERESGRALVTDFGIASRVDDANCTALAGTAQFMSPEQTLGQPVDGRADLYALGLVAHVALSGQLPIHATELTDTSISRISSPPRSLAVTCPDLPANLIHIVDTCLQLDVSKRWANAESLLKVLEPDREVLPRLPERLRDWAHSRSWLATMLPAWSVYVLVNNVYAGTIPRIFGGTEWIRVAIFMGLPVVGIGVVRLLQTRAVLMSGLSLADLRHALRLREGAGEDGYRAGNESNSRRILRALTLTGVGVAALATFGVYMWGYSTRTGELNTGLTAPWQIQRDSLVHALSTIAHLSFYVSAWGSVLLATFDAGILPVNAERRVFGRLRELFWNSRAGEWLAFKLTPKHRSLASTHIYPTEMAVAVAADKLFAALPLVYRDSLSQVPAIIARLTTRATTLRDSIDQMSKIMVEQGAAGEEVLGETVLRSRDQLDETVSALERIRLELLRLHGGLADLRPITTTLNGAEFIGADIIRLTLAQREVGLTTASPFDRSTPTPA